jgi:general secretion pathway protein G
MAASSRRANRGASGFTLVELLIAIAIAGVLLLIAFPAYSDYKERVRVAQAVTDIKAMSALINNYYIDARRFPPDLNAVGNAGKLDPWGRPYVYLNLQNPALKGKGQFRKNKNLVPINSDFDLYSVGKDGASVGPLTAKTSQDDVIRANDGAYVGLASKYE